MRQDGNIDYSGYTYRELLEALNNINANQYPKNYANLQAALEKIGPIQQMALRERTEAPEATVDFDDAPATDPDLLRVKHFLTVFFTAVISILLLSGGSISLPTSPPAKITLGTGGAPFAWGSLLLALTVPLSFIVDYIDKRDNRKQYLLFVASVSGVSAILLFLACSFETGAAA